MASHTIAATLPRAQVVVIGAGPAGLAVSHELAVAGLEHRVLERFSIAQSWRRRWDSFCLVTPNRLLMLPGIAYTGAEPQGFEPRDGVVDFLERYAASFQAPVWEGVNVRRLSQRSNGFELATSEGSIEASQVVVATGAHQKPHRPAGAETLPSSILVIDANDYRNASQLPAGRVLIVGSGQTGCQLAEDLRLAGRDVVLSCGRAPWAPRRWGGRDYFDWLIDAGWFDQPVAIPLPVGARFDAIVQLTGRDGGHDLHFRVLQEMDVVLTGRLAGVRNGCVQFASDLADSVAFGDARWAEVRKYLDRSLKVEGSRMTLAAEPPTFAADPPSEVPLKELGAVIFACGYRPVYQSWIDIPAFDDMGFPLTVEGSSSVAPGLHFIGVRGLRSRRSSFIWGMAEDAKVVAQSVLLRVGRRTPPSAPAAT